MALFTTIGKGPAQRSGLLLYWSVRLRWQDRAAAGGAACPRGGDGKGEGDVTGSISDALIVMAIAVIALGVF